MCPHHIRTTDDCSLRDIVIQTVSNTAEQATPYEAPSYEEKLQQYEHDRNELLKLSKEALVDLIIHKPEKI